GGGSFRGAWTSRFATHIEQVGAGALDCQGMLDCALWLQEFAAIGKAVRCDVQHAHDQRALAKHERARRQPQAERFSAKGHMRKGSVAQVPCLSLKTKFAPRTSSDDRRYGISSPEFAGPPLKRTAIPSGGALVQSRARVSGKPVFRQRWFLSCR